MSIDRRSLLGIVPVVAILGAFWFVLLAPARGEVKATQAEVVQAAARRDAAVATATAAEQARRSYPSDYASVAKLATTSGTQINPIATPCRMLAIATSVVVTLASKPIIIQPE